MRVIQSLTSTHSTVIAHPETTSILSCLLFLRRPWSLSVPRKSASTHCGLCERPPRSSSRTSHQPTSHQPAIICLSYKYFLSCLNIGSYPPCGYCTRPDRPQGPSAPGNITCIILLPRYIYLPVPRCHCRTQNCLLIIYKA